MDNIKGIDGRYSGARRGQFDQGLTSPKVEGITYGGADTGASGVCWQRQIMLEGLQSRFRHRMALEPFIGLVDILVLVDPVQNLVERLKVDHLVGGSGDFDDRR